MMRALNSEESINQSQTGNPKTYLFLGGKKVCGVPFFYGISNVSLLHRH